MEDRRDKELIKRVFASSLSELKEDPYLAQRVIHMGTEENESHVKASRTLNEENNRRPIYMKKKMKSTFALAVAICLMVSIAFAATLVYSQRYMQANRADELLQEKYGITEDKRSFFTRTSEGDIFTYVGLSDFAGMLGDYQVNVDTGEVLWMYDGPEGSGWDAVKLNEVLMRCQDQGGYKNVTADARAAAEAIELAASDTSNLPLQTPPPVTLEESEESTKQAEALAKLTMEEAEQLGRSAIQEKYGLTTTQMQKLELVEESSYFTMEGEMPTAQPYFWLMQEEGAFTEKDGIYIVVVNALDGTVEDIFYDTGLLGNG